MLRLTGIYADGWYPTIVASPEEYATKLEVIRSSAREASRDPEAITPALQPYIAVAPTEKEARAMLASKAGRYAALLLVPAKEWLKVGVEHPFGEHFRGYLDLVPERYDRRSIEEAIASVPPESVGRNFIWGTPEQVASRLRAFGEAGLRHVVLTLTSALFSKRMAVYGLRATRTIARLLNNGRQ